jgi:acyl carrier protein
VLKSVEETVMAVLLETARTHQPERAAVAPTDSLVDDLGFESLDLATAVAQLEVELGVDPFATETTIGSVRTVGDFVAVYQRARR